MVLESSIFNCYPPSLLVPNLALASVDGFLALVAFYQLTRVHMRNKAVGWTCQKVLHLMIASSNLGKNEESVVVPWDFVTFEQVFITFLFLTSASESTPRS
ncbi:uncharacterized protein LOC112099287 [Citrus clementina]|uniref:uncharacterized protein LOC112099287 n=1 Tax=Citrus clementina TaxID=85681 RepID=UPI000CECEEBE|nr:uncharacterized protein LOC112099287 [Citrus x clementina]